MSEVEVEIPGKKNKLTYLIVGVIALVGLAAIGSVGYLSGAGWFGYRQILYGSGKIYLLNMGDKPFEVSVDGRKAVKVPPQDARTVENVGGQSKVVVTDADGKVVSRHTVVTDHSHALLKVSPNGCLAVSDVGAFYGRGGKDMKIINTIDKDTLLYVPGSTNIIWPREVFPSTMAHDAGQPLWIELVACSLLKEPDFLRAYLDVRLGERLKKARGGKKK